MALALVDIAFYASLFLALAFAVSGRKLTQAFFGPLISLLQRIPAIGPFLAAPFQSIETSIVGAFQTIETGIDNLLGASFHILSEQWNWFWGEFKRHADLLTIGGSMLAAAIYAYKHLRGTVHSATQVIGHAAARLHTLEKEYKGIEHKLGRLERRIGKGIGHDLRVHIRALENWEQGAQKAITQTIPQAIAGVRGGLSDLKGFLGIRNGLTYLEWAAGIVASAIGAEALNLFRCSTFQNKTAKRGCGLWDALEKLLPLGVLLAAGFTFQEFVDAAETVAEGIGTFVGDLEKPFVGSLPPLPPPQG